LTGDIADTLKALTPLLRPRAEALANPLLKAVVEEMAALRERGSREMGVPCHPLRLVRSCSPS